MKLSVSLSDEDVAVLDAYVKNAGLASRSAALQHAIRMLRHAALEHDYAAAWSEWAEAEEADFWAETLNDGLGDAPR